MSNSAVQINLDDLNLSQLSALAGKLEQAQRKAKARERAEVRQKISELVHSRGLKLDDVMPQARKRPRKTARYINPDNPSQTWSGLGRRPHWFKESMRDVQQKKAGRRSH